MRRLSPTLLLVLAYAGAVAAQEPPAGKPLYVENCIDCHGDNAEGDDMSPDIRGANRSLLDRVLPGFDQMPEFEFTEDEIQALEAYLAELDN